jgi:hypothetical protein
MWKLELVISSTPSAENNALCSAALQLTNIARASPSQDAKPSITVIKITKTNEKAVFARGVKNVPALLESFRGKTNIITSYVSVSRHLASITRDLASARAPPIDRRREPAGIASAAMAPGPAVRDREDEEDEESSKRTTEAKMSAMMSRRKMAQAQQGPRRTDVAFDAATEDQILKTHPSYSAAVDDGDMEDQELYEHYENELAATIGHRRGTGNMLKQR